jgi:hypothetical protein
VALRAVRDLPHGRRRLPDGIGDLVVRHVEDLAQHEDDPLCRPEGLQHGQHGDGQVLREPDVVRHVGAGEQRLGEPFADVLLAPPGHGPQMVERLPRHHAHEVGTGLADLRPIDRRPPEP